VRTQIHDFGKLIGKTEKMMLPFKEMVKKLASSRDTFDKTFRTCDLTQLFFLANAYPPTSNNALSNA